MLPRSISLLCRHPKPVSIDLTFETANLEEDFRLWVNKRLTISLVSVVEKSNKSVSKALQGLSPSDNDDDNDSDDDTAFSEDQSRQTEPRLTSSHSTPGTSARGGKGGSAVVYPASRRTGALKQRQSQSERWDRQPASARSDPGRLKDEESTYKAMWTWKEPPVLRKLDSGSSSGSRPRSARARSLSRARGGITSLSEEAAAAGAGAAGAAGPPRSDRPLSMTASGSAADFWDPFGLMSDVTSMTPPAKKTVPSRGSRRDFLLSSGGSGKGGSRGGGSGGGGGGGRGGGGASSGGRSGSGRGSDVAGGSAPPEAEGRGDRQGTGSSHLQRDRSTPLSRQSIAEQEGSPRAASGEKE